MPDDSSEKDESNAKVWQLKNVAKDVAAVKDIVQQVSNKLDDKYVSKEQLEATIKYVELQHNNEIQGIKDRYEPMRRNLSQLIWVLIGLVVAVVGQLIVNVFGSKGL